MNFLQPFAVWFLAGLPLIVLLYFLRLRRRTETVSTHLFWQRVLDESSRRAFFQRLRHVFSLLLHLLIFTLIVAALARPFFNRPVEGGASTVVILDARARMQAREADGRTRFEKAVEAVREYARQAGGDRELALVVLGANLSVEVPFTPDQKQLEDGLEGITVSDAGGDLEAALTLSDALLASRSGEKRTVLISDRVPEKAGVVAHVAGAKVDNVAITRFATRPVPVNPATSEVLLEVRNFGEKPVETEVEIAFDGRVLEVRPFKLGPGEHRQEVFASVPRPARSARGWLVAKLAQPDALELDNVAYATLAPAKATRVLLVSKGNPFIEKFLAADPALKFEVLDAEAWTPALGAKFEVVILDGMLPGGFSMEAIEQAGGNYLFLRASPFSASEALEEPLITEVDAAHPITRLAALQNITVQKAAMLAQPAREGWVFSAPLKSFDHPLLLAGERRGQRVAATAFDLLESDLPLRVAFPLMMANTIQWLANTVPDVARTARAGETIELRDGEKIAATPVTTPPKTPPELAVEGFLQPLRNGYYALGGEAVQWLAVNTFDAEESDTRAASGASAPEKAAEWNVTTKWRALPPWQWLALAALALFTGEWFLFHRRKTE